MAASIRITKARKRRTDRALERVAQTEWFINEVSDVLVLTMQKRMRIATEYIHSKVMVNISRPVTITRGPRGGKVVTNRSKPGEYPKAETGQLQKTIMSRVVRPSRDVIEGQIGTPLDYGAILELWPQIDRAFLSKTLTENKGFVFGILTGPISRF